MQEVGEEGPFARRRGQFVPNSRTARAQALERAAYSVPGGQVEPRLAPTEHPRDGAQVVQRGTAAAARRPRPDVARFNRVDRRGLREELHKSVHLHQFPVDAATCERGGLEEVVERRARRLRLALVNQRPPRYPRQQALQVRGGGEAVGILLCHHLALLGDAHFPVQRAGRQRFEKHVCGTGPAADGAAAAVKEAQVDLGAACHGSQLNLRLAKVPVARQDAAVLVAVAVADHDLLQRAGTLLALLKVPQRALGHGMSKEILEHTSAIFQVANGFEQGRNGDFAHQPLRRYAHQSGLPRQQVDVQQVGDLVGQAHDQRADAAETVLAAPLAHHPQQPHTGFGLGRQGCGGHGEGARRVQFAVNQLALARLAPAGVISPVHAGGG